MTCQQLAANPHNSQADHLCTNRISFYTSVRCSPNSRGRVCSLFPNCGFGFNASDVFCSELLDIRPGRSLRQAGMKNRDRVLAVERHAKCRSLASCRMECLGEQGRKVPVQSASRRRQLSTNSRRSGTVLRASACADTGHSELIEPFGRGRQQSGHWIARARFLKPVLRSLGWSAVARDNT